MKVLSSLNNLDYYMKDKHNESRSLYHMTVQSLIENDILIVKQISYLII